MESRPKKLPLEKRNHVMSNQRDVPITAQKKHYYLKKWSKPYETKFDLRTPKKSDFQEKNPKLEKKVNAVWNFGKKLLTRSKIERKKIYHTYHNGAHNITYDIRRTIQINSTTATKKINARRKKYVIVWIQSKKRARTERIWPQSKTKPIEQRLTGRPLFHPPPRRLLPLRRLCLTSKAWGCLWAAA